MKKFWPLIRRTICIILLIAFIVTFAILKKYPDICEAITRGPSRIYTLVVSKLTAIVPFSLTEVTYVAIAAIIVTLLVLLIIGLVKKKWISAGNRFLEGAIVILLTISFYDFSCECAYNRKAIPLPYYENEVLRTEHTAIYNYFADDVNACINELEFTANGDVKPSIDFYEVVKEVKKAYAIIDGNDYFYSHFGNVKPMASSFIYTEFQITGVTYSPLSEANINL